MMKFPSPTPQAWKSAKKLCKGPLLSDAINCTNLLLLVRTGRDEDRRFSRRHSEDKLGRCYLSSLINRTSSIVLMILLKTNRKYEAVGANVYIGVIECIF